MFQNQLWSVNRAPGTGHWVPVRRWRTSHHLRAREMSWGRFLRADIRAAAAALSLAPAGWVPLLEPPATAPVAAATAPPPPPPPPPPVSKERPGNEAAEERQPRGGMWFTTSAGEVATKSTSCVTHRFFSHSGLNLTIRSKVVAGSGRIPSKSSWSPAPPPSSHLRNCSSCDVSAVF